jgi:hypothetical protein
VAGPHCCAVCWQGGGGDSVGAVADLAKDFVIVHNEIQTLRKEVGEMKKALTGLSSMQSEHLAALQSGKRSNSMVRYTPVALSLAPWGRSKHALCSACLPGRRFVLLLQDYDWFQCGTSECHDDVCYKPPHCPEPDKNGNDFGA